MKKWNKKRSKINKNIMSIYKISLLIKNEKDSAMVIGNYLDEFKNATYDDRLLSVASEPVKGIKEKGTFLAGMVEQLCLNYALPIPHWVNKRKYFLKKPLFYSRFENLKATLLQESPTSFRRRNIFVSSNVLSRV